MTTSCRHTNTPHSLMFQAAGQALCPPSTTSTPCPHPHDTYETLRLCALLKPAKEALRPTVPTAPASPGDRKRNRTDMAVT